MKMAQEMKVIPKDKTLPESLDKVVRSDGEVSSSTMSSPDASISDIKKKISELKVALAHSKLSCDIKWSMFVSACQSYRVSSCLHPFPPMFVKNGQKDIAAVHECIDQMSHLSSILNNHSSGMPPPPHLHPLIHLLHWLLTAASPRVTEVPRSQYDDILGLVESSSETAKPDFIFGVEYAPSSSIETTWSKLRASRKKVIHAFHGSRLENFHSILHFGLQQHMNKTSLFGKGIYLAARLSICLIFSPYSIGWRGSCVGSELSVVALCSILDDADQVKCQEDSEENKRRALAQDSIGGEVPHKYYVVENSDLVKLQYLLVYSRHKVASHNEVHRHPPHPLLAWAARNKFLLLLLGYSLLLIVIGLGGNMTFQRYYRYYVNRLCEMLGSEITM